eukprot:2293412-Rhodomonas_salina.1
MHAPTFPDKRAVQRKCSTETVRAFDFAACRYALTWPANDPCSRSRNAESSERPTASGDLVTPNRNHVA